MAINNIKPEPPATWNPEKKEIFYDLCERLEDCKLLDSGLRPIIIQYVDAFVMYRKAVKWLDNGDPVAFKTSTKGNEIQVVDKWYEVYHKQSDMLLRLLRTLGVPMKERKDILSETLESQSSDNANDDVSYPVT